MTAHRKARRDRRGGKVAVGTICLALLLGCGAQDLYEPPIAPWSIVGRLALPSQVEDVAVLGEVAYVAGGQAGLIIIDVSNPSVPTLLLMLDTVKFAEAVKVASTSSAEGVIDIAFVVEGTEGITTYDITDPATAFSFGQGTTAVDGNGLFIELPDNPDDPYVVYLAESWKGLRIFESDRTIPGLLHYNGVFASTRGYAKAVTVKDGFAYVADDEMGLAVLDVRTRVLGSVVMVSSVDTKGYAYGVDLRKGYACIAEGFEGLTIAEIREVGIPPVPVPSVVSRLELPGKCRAIVVRDGNAFIAAQDGGVHIVDVTDPASPSLLGTVITSYATGLGLTESGNVVVSDRDEGFLVLAGPGPFADMTPPADVNDLTAMGVDSTTVRLEWHAPGGDGLTGTPSTYDIRYALSSIGGTDDWEAATQAEGEPTPSARGGAESFDVEDLIPGTEYFFALRTADGRPNWSGLSNVASATTPSGNVAPTLREGGVTPDAGTADTTFLFTVTYEDGDGDPPTEARVFVDSTAYDMAEVTNTYEMGLRVRHHSSGRCVRALLLVHRREAPAHHDRPGQRAARGKGDPLHHGEPVGGGGAPRERDPAQGSPARGDRNVGPRGDAERIRSGDGHEPVRLRRAESPGGERHLVRRGHLLQRPLAERRVDASLHHPRACGHLGQGGGRLPPSHRG
jgi:hypothetical protein